MEKYKVAIESWIYGSDHYIKGQEFPKGEQQISRLEVEHLLKSGFIEINILKKDK